MKAIAVTAKTIVATSTIIAAAAITTINTRIVVEITTTAANTSIKPAKNFDAAQKFIQVTAPGGMFDLVVGEC